jgi:hypothetical protein
MPSRVEDALRDFPCRAKNLDENRAPAPSPRQRVLPRGIVGIRIMIIRGRTEFYDKLLLFLRRIYEKGMFVA